MVTTRQQYTLQKLTRFMREPNTLRLICYIVRKKPEDKIVVAKHVSSGHQLADLLTKPLGKTMIYFICDKLGIYDVYTPA